MQDLAKIKAGEIFTLRGFTYRASEDAKLHAGSIWIDAVRQNGAVPSGWELATVMEPATSCAVFAPVAFNIHMDRAAYHYEEARDFRMMTIDSGYFIPDYERAARFHEAEARTHYERACQIRDAA